MIRKKIKLKEIFDSFVDIKFFYFQVIHAVIGLVRSNSMIVITQVSSRVFICVTLLSLPSDFFVSSVILPFTFISWCIAEITKYSYYFMNRIGYIPYFLTWLR